MGAPTATVNGRLAPGIQTLPPHVQRQLSLETPLSSPLLNYKSPIGSAYDPPVSQSLHPGCVLCGYVASATAQAFGPSAPGSPVNQAIHLPSPARSATPDLRRPGPSTHPAPSSSSPRGTSSLLQSPALRPLQLVTQQRESGLVSGHRIIHRDALLTVYPAEGKEALRPNGQHIVLLLNQHLTSVYELGPGDIPLLSHIVKTATRLLLATLPESDVAGTTPGLTAKDVSVGFVNGMPRDPRFPYPHLHAQAFLGPFDKTLPGSTLWRRNVVYGNLNWWSVDDLRAEIREETSNNRVKSGYEDRFESPINKVPDAGTRNGLANALDPTCQSPEVLLTSDEQDIVAAKAKAKEKAKQRQSLLRTDSTPTARPTPPTRSYSHPADNTSVSSTDTR